MSNDRKQVLTEARQWVEQERVWDNQLYATEKSMTSKPKAAPHTVAPAPSPVAAPTPVTPVAEAAPSPKMTSAKSFALQALYQKYKGCLACGLGKSRIKFVFGVGNPDSKVLFVGEGPGFQEDRMGEPFIGRAGQLLDKMMAAIGLDRKTNAYIANIVKCHPMTNPETPDAHGNDRPPTPEEVATCSPILKAQIGIIRPKVIVTLGSPSTKTLLMTQEPISKIRGKLYPFPKAYFQTSHDPKDADLSFLDSVQILPMFHPAALLRNPNLKKETWEDLKLLRDTIAKQ